MEPMLPTDVETNHLFDDVVERLRERFGYSISEASNLVRNYYKLFSDPTYCGTIGIPAQDEDFFFHEGAGGMALRIHYYLGLKEDPDPHHFIEWRSTMNN